MEENEFLNSPPAVSCNNQASDDEIEFKPLFANFSDVIETHSIHDFNIHLHKRKEFSLIDGITSLDSNNSVVSHSDLQQKCCSSFLVETCCGVKRWTAEDVSKVISLETIFFRNSSLIVKFPDKKVSKQIVSKLHPSIRAVNFVQSPYARRCCVTLKDPSKMSEIIVRLNSTRFGTGFLSADNNYEELRPSILDIDPFTLFLDDIPLQLEAQTLSTMFPDSQQITVGYTNKIYYIKRYAFVVFLTVKDAIERFKTINKRSDVIVRFRRFSGSAHVPSETEISRCQKNGNEVFPIVIDPGPPVCNTSRNYSLVLGTTKKEPGKDWSEIVVDNSDNSDDEDAPEETECADMDFDSLYEQMMHSRMEMSLLRENVLNDTQN